MDSDSDFTYKALKAGKTTIEFSSTDGAVKAVCNITIEDNEEDTDNSYKVSVSKGYLAFRKDQNMVKEMRKGNYILEIRFLSKTEVTLNIGMCMPLNIRIMDM